MMWGVFDETYPTRREAQEAAEVLYGRTGIKATLKPLFDRAEIGKLKQAQSRLERYLSVDGPMSKFGYSISDLEGAELILQDFADGASCVYTVIEDVARFFKDCGFNVLAPSGWSTAYTVGL